MLMKVELDKKSKVGDNSKLQKLVLSFTTQQEFDKWEAALKRYDSKSRQTGFLIDILKKMTEGQLNGVLGDGVLALDGQQLKDFKIMVAQIRNTIHGGWGWNHRDPRGQSWNAAWTHLDDAFRLKAKEAQLDELWEENEQLKETVRDEKAAKSKSEPPPLPVRMVDAWTLTDGQCGACIEGDAMHYHRLLYRELSLLLEQLEWPSVAGSPRVRHSVVQEAAKRWVLMRCAEIF